MILLCGATGRVGGALLRELLAANAPVRCLVRDPDRARAQFAAADAARDGVLVPLAKLGGPHTKGTQSNGPQVEWARGDFGDSATVAAALHGVERVFVMSPVSADLAAQQINLVNAAARAGVTRIVKLSGSSWTMPAGTLTAGSTATATTTATGTLHAQVEAAITATGVTHTLVRPTVFMQGMLSRIIESITQTDSFGLALGNARAAFIDIGDIAEVASHALLAGQALGPVLDITGPQAYSGEDIARIASALTARSISYQALLLEAALARASSVTAFMQCHLRDVLTLMLAGEAANVTDTVAQICGRPARPVEDWLHAALVAATPR